VLRDVQAFGLRRLEHAVATSMARKNVPSPFELDCIKALRLLQLPVNIPGHGRITFEVWPVPATLSM
jgi:hypothetical protein